MFMFFFLFWLLVFFRNFATQTNAGDVCTEPTEGSRHIKGVY